MEKTEENKKVLNWKHEGLGMFRATVINDKLYDFRACANGSQTNINTDNLQFLIKVRDSISELLKEMKIE